MKFSYKSIPISTNAKSPLKKKVLRPIIPIKVKYKNKDIGYEVLIDSGADYCVFHSAIAEVLGIPWKEGNSRKLGGISGQQLTGYFSRVAISVGGHEIESKVLFSPNIPGFGYGILGQVGFFEFFRIRFIYQKGDIEIKPEPRLN